MVNFFPASARIAEQARLDPPRFASLMPNRTKKAVCLSYKEQSLQRFLDLRVKCQIFLCGSMQIGTYFSENFLYIHIYMYVNIYCFNCISAKQTLSFVTVFKYCISVVTHPLPSVIFRSFTMASLRK